MVVPLIKLCWAEASEICRDLLSRFRAPPPASWPGGGSERLRSPCCGLTGDHASCGKVQACERRVPAGIRTGSLSTLPSMSLFTED
ncbi:hypothetical protein PoB_006416300 [Plakobranchus ocellatus]|uniref:Uncharacterized protein n=1 Tax=Plakobranchus ocellatus TaxID=259542 RepID=A0AAV4D0U2_9GAST|nr:hypothetical protein PoB_006416300 [Plakobranchus ocellatus]